MNCVFFSSGPMVLSAASKICVCSLAADSLEANPKGAMQILAGSLAEI